MRGPTWPAAADYLRAVVEPDALGDPRLREGRLEFEPGGVPKAYAGRSTATFHFATVDGEVALRCYTRGAGDIERRYTAITDLLRYVRSDALCRTQYLAEGIRVGGEWWPAIAMAWADGRPLRAEIAARLADGDAVAALATTFRETVRSLDVLGVAHGDLQHGNIVVTAAGLRLIDYDAMFVPALAGLAQTEYGHPNYQHPDRRSAPFDGRLDRFAALVIYTALVALAADPSLWARFDAGDNVLFRAHDFTSGGRSELFHALLENNAASGLADVLIAACRAPVTDVPTLEGAIQSAAGTMVAQATPPAPRPRPSAVRRTALDVPPPLPPVAAGTSAAPAAIERTASGRPALGIVLALAALAAVVVGFAFGTLRHRADGTPVARTSHHVVAVAAAPAKRNVPPAGRTRPSATPKSSPTVVPSPTATPMPSATPTATPTPSATPAATPTPQRTATAAATPTATASTPATSIDAATAQGAWQIDEANVADGAMLWSGTAVARGNGAIVLDAHKSSVAGRAASDCERRTNLHATVALGASQQIVPYEETNCEGNTSAGEVRVTHVAADGHSFSGTFYQNGVKLGDFTASKQ